MLEVVAKVDADLAEGCVKAEDLTDFAVKYRYPEAIKKEFTRADAADAASVAKSTCAAILRAASALLRKRNSIHTRSLRKLAKGRLHRVSYQFNCIHLFALLINNFEITIKWTHRSLPPVIAGA